MTLSLGQIPALLPLFLAPAIDGAEDPGAPLRIFLRAGPKTHGEGQHDHPRFLEEWRVLLSERGSENVAVEGALRFPTAEELARTDVLVLYAAEGATIRGEERANFETFVARGGGLVVLHDAVCGDDPHWFQELAGGAWEHGHSKWKEGEVGLYFSDPDHPITRGVANFDFVDEIYHDLHVSEKATVLASSFHSVFDITPQMWVVDEGESRGRAFVSLQGHEYSSFSHPAWRTLVLRGIAWAGRRDVELFTAPEEVATLAYPPGGPLAPDAAHTPFALHEDFEIELMAAEPVVVNPISIDWDARGRMWVVLTPSYPYKQKFEGKAADEVALLFDDDGDGRMDRRHTFAGGLDLATSLVFHRDGVIVTAAPDIFFLRDTDGDDVADVREVLFTGFGYGDTHAVISNLRWGMDGWIYATQGYSGNASRNIVNARGEDFGHIPNGLFRFKPDGSAIEAHSVYGSNTWGLDFDWSGELFFTMANGSHLRHVVMSENALGPERLKGTRSWNDIVDHRKVNRISRADREPYVQIDFVGGFTAAAGSLIYSGGAWPQEYNGNHFVCEPTVNLIHRDVLRPDGVTFKATRPREAEFLASSDPWFRPVHLRTGPDGALYVLDFYNQAAVHNDTRGPKHGPTNAAVRPDRDDRHGRIWRVNHRRPQFVSSGLDSANRWARMTAQRELVESGRVFGAPDSTSQELMRLWKSSREAQVHLLWALHLTELPAIEYFVGLALDHEDAGVRRAATEVGRLHGIPARGLVSAIDDEDPRIRLGALTAMQEGYLDAETLALLIEMYPDLEDQWSRSALLRVVGREPLASIGVALESAEHEGLLEELVARVAAESDADRTVSALEMFASHEWRSPATLEASLIRLQAELPTDSLLPGSAECVAAVKALVGRHHQPEVAIAALPLAARLADGAALAETISTLATNLLETVENPDADLADRERSLFTLLAMPDWHHRAIEASARFLDPYFPLDTQVRVIEQLGRLDLDGVVEVLTSAFPGITHDAREAAFEVLVVRPRWAERFLERVELGDISARDLGPYRVHRLRNHPAPSVALRANAVLGELGSESGEKSELIASLLPDVTRPGDIEAGKQLFTKNCSNCHDFDRLDEPGRSVGPALTGMGAHGREHLLPFLIDPNLSVEAAYVEYVAEKTDGTIAAGVLTYDGKDSITLAGSDGDVEVRRDEIESIYSSGLSPMPTGFEELGAEALRDILAFLCQGYEDYRLIDLELLCSASTNALYDSRRDAQPMRFTRTGVIEVEGVPLEVLAPDGTASGKNAIVLKGGAVADWESKTMMPQEVRVPVGFALQRMHVLGGIAAWGHPFFGQREPILRWTWNYADGTNEEVVLRDGDQFADWIGRHEVEGSRYVEDLLQPGSVGQVRTFHLDPSRTDVAVESITLSSFDNRMAPTFLGLTAQLRGAVPDEAKLEVVLTQPDVLIVGGGSSHDFPRWFDRELRATLASLADDGLTEIEYTGWPDDVLPRLDALEVLVLSNNQPLADPALREGIFAHVARGGGLVLVHPALWYNWADWPEYNAQLVGGGSRSHESYGTFDVSLGAEAHPILAGVPARFAVDDELYRFEPDPSGSPIEVLARGTSRSGGASYPVLWTVSRGDGRIVCLTLGHDGAAHEHPAFQTILRNAVRWAKPR